MKIKTCISLGILVSSLITPCAGKAQTSVSAWEFYCKYFANATLAEIGENISSSSYIDYYSYKPSKSINKHKQFQIKLGQFSNQIVWNEDYSYKDKIAEKNAGLDMQFTAAISSPYYAKNSIVWNSNNWEMTTTTKGPYYDNYSPNAKSRTFYTWPKNIGNTPWKLLASDFYLKEVTGNTYTFSCKTISENMSNLQVKAPIDVLGDEYYYEIGQGPRYSKYKTFKCHIETIKLTIPSSALSETDEFGRWKWNDDKTEIWVNSTGELWNSNEIQFKIIRQGNSLQLALDGSASAFGNPDSTSNGYEIYELGFSFGGSYQILKFINVGTSPLGKRLIYGSYNRFTGELDTDGTSVLQQFKTNKYCVVKVGTGQNIQSFVFPLEGLETLMDYIN